MKYDTSTYLKMFLLFANQPLCPASCSLRAFKAEFVMTEAQIVGYRACRTNAPVVLENAVEAAPVDAVEELLSVLSTVVVGRAVWADADLLLFGRFLQSLFRGELEHVRHALFELIHGKTCEILAI